MDLQLEGKVALVTGGGEGIGRRTCLIFAQEGVNLVVNDVIADRANHVADEARAQGVKALPVVADVTKPGEVDGMVEKALSEYGKIDILVNNAFAWDRKRFTQSVREEWEQPINVCLYGVLNCSWAVINHMVERKYGKVINLVSDAGLVGEMTSPIYAAAKAGILSFSRSLAKEVGRHGINVNCVSPGAINTERRIREHQAEWDQADEEKREKITIRNKKQLKFYPLGRIGKPEDVGNMIVYLASDVAGYITGQVMPVDGGYAMV